MQYKKIKDFKDNDQIIIGFNKLWIDEDFNPNGTRICFKTDSSHVGWCSSLWLDDDFHADYNTSPTHFIEIPSTETLFNIVRKSSNNKYIRKQTIIEAIQFTGRNKTEVELFVGSRLEASIPPRAMEFDKEIPKTGYSVIIPTREGQMTAYKMDWILKGYTEELGFHFWVNEENYFNSFYDKL